MTPNEPLPEDYELARTLGLADAAVLIHEMRRIAHNGGPWAARYGVATAVNVLRAVGDMSPLPEPRSPLDR